MKEHSYKFFCDLVMAQCKFALIKSQPTCECNLIAQISVNDLPTKARLIKCVCKVWSIKMSGQSLMIDRCCNNHSVCLENCRSKHKSNRC